MKKVLLAVIAAATVGTFMVLEWRRESEALAAKAPTVAAQASTAPPALAAPPPECRVKQVEIDKKRSRRVLLREPLMPVENGHQDDDCELKTTVGAWTCWPREGRVLVERCMDKDGTP